VILLHTYADFIIFIRLSTQELVRIAHVVEYTAVGINLAVLFIHDNRIFQLEKELSYSIFQLVEEKTQKRLGTGT
jgi:hypothetical protein